MTFVYEGIAKLLYIFVCHYQAKKKPAARSKKDTGTSAGDTAKGGKGKASAKHPAKGRSKKK